MKKAAVVVLLLAGVAAVAGEAGIMDKSDRSHVVL